MLSDTKSLCLSLVVLALVKTGSGVPYLVTAFNIQVKALIKAVTEKRGKVCNIFVCCRSCLHC